MSKTIHTAQYQARGNSHAIAASVAGGRPPLEDPTKLEDGAVRIVGWRTPKHVVIGLVKIGMAKGQMPWYKSFVMGAFGGLCISFGGLLAIISAAGLHAEPTLTPPQPTVGWVGADRLVLGLTFPVALVLITLSGAELFTGNTLYATVALLARKVRLRDAAVNLVWSYCGNLAGCLFGAYFFGYLTDVTTAEPYAAYTRYIALAKTHVNWGKLVLRGIPCNMLVCLAIMCGLAADTAFGKVVGLWVPIVVFAVCGFEHCVANMFFIPLGMLNGASATVSVGRLVGSNLIPVTIGNGIGAAFFIGAVFYAVYQPHMTRQIDALKLKYVAASSTAAGAAAAPDALLPASAPGTTPSATPSAMGSAPAHAVVMDLDMVAAPSVRDTANSNGAVVIHLSDRDGDVHGARPDDPTGSAAPVVQVAHR